MEREPLRCPMGVFDPDREEDCCISCVYRPGCIWCRIYEKLTRIEESGFNISDSSKFSQ